MLEELTYEEPLGKSDHVCLAWQMCFRKQKVHDDLKYNYWKADYSALREMLSQVNWNAEFESRCVNDM